jgi:hypothetical protein
MSEANGFAVAQWFVIGFAYALLGAIALLCWLYS